MKLSDQTRDWMSGADGADKSLLAEDMRSTIAGLLEKINAFADTGSPHDPYEAVGRVFEPLDGPFLELESYAVEANQAIVREILSDPEILAMLPQAYAVRALSEYELEWRCASETIASPRAPELIAKQVEDKLEALPSAFYEVLAGCQRILFAGSGPFPTTAMALHRKFDRPVVCIDRDGRANELAQDYVSASEIPYDIEFVASDLAHFSDFGKFDCVVCAFLIGVGTSAQPLETKSIFIRDVVKKMPANLPIVLRSPQGLGRLVYPSLEPSAFGGYSFVENPDSSLPPVPYDKSFTVIEKI
jgi:hypothetical protein